MKDPATFFAELAAKPSAGPANAAAPDSTNEAGQIQFVAEMTLDKPYGDKSRQADVVSCVIWHYGS